jgi:AAA15 family ATPase/GTPase
LTDGIKKNLKKKGERRCMETTLLKITSLRIKQFLGIEDEEISPDSKLNYFIGKNGEGKTSFIKAIFAGFKGTSDKSVIRGDAEKSDIYIELDDLKIHRTLKSAGNNTLKVTAPVTLPGGETRIQPLPAPQDYLDGLMSDFSFDPILFITQDGKERTKYIRDLFKTKLTPEMLAFLDKDRTRTIDFTKDGLDVLKEIHDDLYAERTKVNTTLKEAKALHNALLLKISTFILEEYVDRSEELAEAVRDQEIKLTEAQTIKRQAEGTLAYVNKLTEKLACNKEELANIDEQAIAGIPEFQSDILNITNQINALKQLLETTETMLSRAQDKASLKERLITEITSDEATLEALPSVNDIPDIASIEGKLVELKGDIGINNIKKDLYLKYLETEKVRLDCEEAEAKSKTMTAAINKLKKDLPEQLIKEANIPIEGIRFEGDKIFIGEMSLDNMSTSEQVRFAVQIVEKFNENKPFKILCLDRAESLDDETLKEFVAQIPNEYQFFITAVQHGDQVPDGAYLVEKGKATKKKKAKAEEVAA